MENQVQEGLEGIVAEFAVWVKGVAVKAAELKDESDVQRLEMELREGGQAIVLELMRQLMQSAVDAAQERSRTCPRCGGRRRHQGVRPRRLLSSLGTLRVRGIYWRCPACGECGHSAEGVIGGSMSKLMRGLTCLLGVSLASFDKAELVARRILGVAVDDNTIRLLCQREGRQAGRQQDQPPEPVPAGKELIGSCDGTSVNTRETGWREIKGFRFEHAGGRYGGAYLEKVERFVPRMVEAARRMGAAGAGRRLFLSDNAIWIIDAVKQHLPQWKHIADYWHGCQHVYSAGELLYGGHDPRSGRWSRYWCRRLRRCGAAVVEQRLRKLALFYRGPTQQRAVLEVAAFLARHGSRMDYPNYEKEGLPISSGPMESFCKQIGHRMKGAGMRWSVRNVSAMASLVSRWSLDAERCVLFGAVPSAN